MNALHVLGLLLALGIQGPPWNEPACDCRVEIHVEGDLYHRDDCQATVLVDFERLLGPARRLAADSLVLSDSAGRRVAVEVAQDSRVQHASGNPVIRLRWPCVALNRFEDRVWRLYFRTVKTGQPVAWRRVDKVFDREEKGGAHHLPERPEGCCAQMVPATFFRPGLLYATSFEKPEAGRPQRPQGFDPAGRDGPAETSDRSWAEGVAHTGHRSLKIARTLTGVPKPSSNRPHWRTWPPPAVEVHPGEVYRLTGWLKCARIKEDAGSSVSLIFLDADRHRLVEPRVRFNSNRREHDWLQLAVSATAPPNARYVEISFGLHGEGEVYLDDLELVVVAGSRIPDPAVRIGTVDRRPGP